MVLEEVGELRLPEGYPRLGLFLAKVRAEKKHTRTTEQRQWHPTIVRGYNCSEGSRCKTKQTHNKNQNGLQDAGNFESRMDKKKKARKPPPHVCSLDVMYHNDPKGRERRVRPTA